MSCTTARIPVQCSTYPRRGRPLSQCSKDDCSKDPSYKLCRVCEKSLRYNLRELGSLWLLLATHPEMHLAVVGAFDSHHRVRFGPPAPVDLTVLDLIDTRGSAYKSVMEWAASVGKANKTARRLRNLSDATEYLAVQSGWVARYEPRAVELLEEIRAYLTHLRRVVYGERRPPGPVPCPVYLPESGPCSGHLRLQSNGTVNCPKCQTIWHYEEWARLGAMIAS